MCSTTLTWKVTLMKSFSSKLAFIVLLVAVAFVAFGYYASVNANARDNTMRQARARWAWVAASTDLFESVPDDEVLGDECEDCNGNGFVGDGTVRVECDTCNGTGKRGFQMTILKMPVQPVQPDYLEGGCAAQGKPIRTAAKRGRVFLGRVLRKIRCRK